MAPPNQPKPLNQLCLESLTEELLQVITNPDNVDYEHDPKSNILKEVLDQHVREEIQNYICTTLPAQLQSQIISKLVSNCDFRSPQMVLQLLFSSRLRVFELELTNTNTIMEGDAITRINEDDISRSLGVIDSIFIREGSDKFTSLEQFLLLDKSEDPDFQGNPINNMTNTNINPGSRVGDWAGIMGRLTKVATHLATCPSLTTLVLPFASDQILAAVSQAGRLKLFQNVYRSTVTEEGIKALSQGPCRLTLTDVVLSLNTHAEICRPAIKKLLESSPQLRVVELGGSGHTKSLYFQGGDAKRRTEVYNAVIDLGAKNPQYRSSLVRLLIFLEGDKVLNLAPLLAHTPNLCDLTLFGWEHIRVDPTTWSAVLANIVKLELVGIGFNTSATDPLEESDVPVKLDCSLLSSARCLRSLRVAGWGDSTVELDTLLHALPHLDTLYLEDIKVLLSDRETLKRRPPHSLDSLTIFHCGTRHQDLIQHLPKLLPRLLHLNISSLYLEDPIRGLPFHFDDPQDHVLNTRNPVADLQLLAKMPHLTTLHLNVSYPHRMVSVECTLPMLLVRQFPSLTSIHLDNYITRQTNILNYTVHRTRINAKLQWFLTQYNKNITANIN